MSNLKNVAAVIVVIVLVVARPVLAETFGFLCEPSSIHVTIYDDGTPTRVGPNWGVGSKAIAYPDPKSGAWVIVELNTDGLTDTPTSIMPDGRTVHSRHLIDVFGQVLAPSQREMNCRRVNF